MGECSKAQIECVTAKPQLVVSLLCCWLAIVMETVGSYRSKNRLRSGPSSVIGKLISINVVNRITIGAMMGLLKKPLVEILVLLS